MALPLLPLLLGMVAAAEPPPPHPRAWVPPLPTPPRMTAIQERLIASIQQKAEAASAAAKPRLLGLLNSPDFDAALGGCCAELLAMSAAERLAWFDVESAAAEQVHNFGTSSGGGGPQSDETIAYGINATYFYNLWEIALLGREASPTRVKGNCTSNPRCASMEWSPDNCTAHPDYVCGSNGQCENDPESPQGYVCHCNATWMGPNCEQRSSENCSQVHSRLSCENTSYLARLPSDSCVWVSAEHRCRPTTPGGNGGGNRHMRQATDVSEVGLFGFPPFPDGAGDYNSQKLTFAMASNRPIYAAMNHRKVDIGNPLFGTVSAIFAPSFVRNMTLIAPIDTGAWQGECNRSMYGGNTWQWAENPHFCDDVANQSTCNDGSLAHAPCDWRSVPAPPPPPAYEPTSWSGEIISPPTPPRCVNALSERQRCFNAATAEECAQAQGLQPPYTPAKNSSDWWARILRPSGCFWRNATPPSTSIVTATSAGQNGTCEEFRCEAAATTAAACHALARHRGYSHSENCKWDTTQGSCVALTEADVCAKAIVPPPPPPPPPPGIPPPPPFPQQPVAQRCADSMGEAGLCRYDTTDHTQNSNGSCVPLICSRIADATTCLQLQNQSTQSGGGGGEPLISCAWRPSVNACVEFDGDCTKLDAAASGAASNRSAEEDCVANILCEWNHTGVNGDAGALGCIRTYLSICLSIFYGPSYNSINRPCTTDIYHFTSCSTRAHSCT
eukprot:COSAG05_NODE_1891_length_3884_cov_5.929450_1_plen_729_part_00